jgi:hypothetical protein
MRATRGDRSGHDGGRYATAAVAACLVAVAALASLPAALSADASDTLRGASLIALAIVLAAILARLVDLWRELLQTRAETLGVIGETRRDIAAAREVVARLRR